MPNNISKDEILKIIDGDTVVDEDGSIRLRSMNTPEKEKLGKTNGDPERAQLSEEALKEILEGGGEVEVSGERGHYGRRLGTLRDSSGQDGAEHMIQANLAAPMDKRGDQASITGIAREALGMKRSNHPDIGHLEQENTYSYDPFSGAEIDSKSYDKRGTFHRSWDRGVDDMQAALGGAINWLGDAIGDVDAQEYGREMAFRNQAATATNDRKINTYKNINNFDDFMDYVVETAGEAAPGLVTDVVAAIATWGSSIPATIARRAGTTALTAAMKRGALAGPAVTGAIQSLGNMENQLEAKGSEKNTGAAALSGLVGGTANVLPFHKVFGDMAKAANLDEAIVATVKDRFKDIAGKTLNTAKGTAGVEGAVTLAQNIIDNVIKAQALDKEFEINTVQMIDDTIRGALGGGIAGGGAMGGFSSANHIAQYTQARADAAKEQDAFGNKIDAQGFQVDSDGKRLREEAFVSEDKAYKSSAEKHATINDAVKSKSTDKQRVKDNAEKSKSHEEKVSEAKQQQGKAENLLASVDDRIIDAVLAEGNTSKSGAYSSAQKSIPVDQQLRAIATAKDGGSQVARKALVELEKVGRKNDEKALHKAINQWFRKVTKESKSNAKRDAEIAGEFTTKVAKAEVDENGVERNVGDVHSEQKLVDDVRSDEQVRRDRGTRKSQNRDLIEQLGRHEALDGKNRLMKEFTDYLNEPTDREKEAGGKDGLSLAKHPNKIIFEKENDAPGKTAGKGPSRFNKRLDNKTMESLGKLLRAKEFEEAKQILDKKGLLNDIPSIGDNPKITLKEKVENTVSNSMYGFRKKSRLTPRKVKPVRVTKEDGTEVDVDGDAITRIGAEENQFDIDGIDKVENLRVGVYRAFHAGVSTLLTESGYKINLDKLPDNTVIHWPKDRNQDPMTLGAVRRYLDYVDSKKAETDNAHSKGKLTDYELEQGIKSGKYKGKFVKGKPVIDDKDEPTAKAMQKELGKDSLNQILKAEEFEAKKEGYAGEVEIPDRKGEESDIFESTIKDNVKSLRDSEIKFKDPTKKADFKTKRAEQRLKISVRKRGAVKKSWLRFVEMTSTRLKRIHPEIEKMVGKFLDTKRKMSERLVIRMSDRLGDAKTIQAGYNEFINGEKTEAANAYKKFVDHIQKEVEKIDPNYEKSEGIPIHLDMDKVVKEKAGFIKILEEAGVENPAQLADRITLGQGYAQFAVEPSSKVVRGNKELEPAMQKLKDGGFLDNDAPRHVVRLIHSASQRIGWAKHAKRYDELANEVHPSNKEEFQRLMSGVTGRLGADMGPWHRRFNSVAMALQTATVLWFSGVASIPEISAVYSRAKGLEGLSSDVKAFARGVDRRQMYKLARDYEIVTGEVVEHALTELYALGEMTTGRFSQKVAQVVFRLNGQDAVTRFTRTLGVAVGRRFLEHHAKVNDAHSKRLLSELDIDSETVLKHLEEAKSGKLDLESSAGEKYQNALHQFVHEAVTNPTADQLPLIANDPRFLIFTSLKKFFYGFYDNVHKALWKERNKRKKEGRSELESLLPMFTTALLALPLAALAEVLREQLKYPLGNGKRHSTDIQDWLTKVATATGGLGPLQAAQSAHEISGYGGNFAVALAGPTTQLAIDSVKGDVRWYRFAGPLNQLPAARKQVEKIFD